MFGELECGLEVCDGIGFGGRGIGCMFGFEGPEVEDEAGP